MAQNNTIQFQQQSPRDPELECLNIFIIHEASLAADGDSWTWKGKTTVRRSRFLNENVGRSKTRTKYQRRIHGQEF